MEGIDAAPWAEAFAELWEACPFRQHLEGADVSVQEAPARRPNPARLTRVLGTGNAAWSLPPDHRGLRDLFVRVIRESREHVLLSALSFYETEAAPALHAVLTGALARGVAVTVLVRPENFAAGDYPDPSTLRLIDKGLRLRGVTGLHAKLLLTDGGRCGLMSANVNPFSLDSGAESANVEWGLVGDAGSAALAPVARLLEALAATPTHEYRP